MINGGLNVSVIIPTYGRSELLERAILSALNQDYEHIEIIVVDDNDINSIEQIKTKKLIERLRIHHEIKYVEMIKNSGGPFARNKGVEVSKGDYICFLDDDDEFIKNKISGQINVLKNSQRELAVVGCFAEILDEKGSHKRFEKNEIKGNVLFEQLKNNVCTTSIAMINKKKFVEVGGFDNVPSSQEHRLFIKIFKANPYYDYVPEVLVNIHHHEGTRISNGEKKSMGAISLYEYIKSLEEYKSLSDQRKKEIDIAHYKNIIRAFMIGKGNRKKALKLYLLFSKKNKYNSESIKYFLIIIFGLSNIEKLQKKIKNWKDRK